MDSKTTPIAKKIMVIRHAEKPTDDELGVTSQGRINSESLTVKGWQRAGALIPFFNHPGDAIQNTQISVPNCLYACAQETAVESMRSMETITPLSERLHIMINKDFGKTEREAMILHAMIQQGTVLISWKHEHIPLIANQILGSHQAPQSWPDDRFDVVWIFDLDSVIGKYLFSQVPQNLLPGDQDTCLT